jgi:hypothetical protein
MKKYLKIELFGFHIFYKYTKQINTSQDLQNNQQI